MKKIVIITGRRIAFRVISTWQNDPKITNVRTLAVYQMNLKTWKRQSNKNMWKEIVKVRKYWNRKIKIHNRNH